MASTFRVNSQSYDGRYMYVYCTQSKDIATNTSTINWTLTVTGGNSAYYSTGPTTVNINGTQVYYKGRVEWNSYAFPAAAGSVSGSIKVSHNSVGECSIPVSISTAIYRGSYYVETHSGTWTLDTIPRQANLTAAPNFTDENNPTITYSNPAGNNVSSLQACISLTGSTDDIAYRDVSKTGTSYTFSLTEAERNVLRNATTGSNSRTVKFFLRTIIGGNTFYSTLDKTLTITNANPTLSPTVVDSNNTTKALTGDANKFIKYYSNAQYSIGASAKKGASIKSTSITCGNKSNTAASGTLSAVESGSFVFSTTDSRGNTVSQTVNKTLINYVKLTCNLDTNNPTADGKMAFKISGNYFNGSFGAVANALTVQYRYKENDGNYGSWTTVTPTLSGNTYSSTTNLTGLNYQSTYTFQARAIDKISTGGINTPEKKVRTTPVFDWSEDNFRFNVPCEVVPGVSYFNGSEDNGGMWRAGREKALMKNTASNSDNYYPMLSFKTPNGAWTIGTIGERLCFHYLSDDDYNAGNNNSAHYEMVNGTNKTL